MKLLVATDAHFFKTPDGAYWCDSVESYQFWLRYLEVFDSVRIVARTKSILTTTDVLKRVDGPNIEIWDIPFYQGPFQLLLSYFDVQNSFRGCYKDCQCALYRMPSQTAQMALSFKPDSLPYAGEIVYCQRDSIVGQPFSIVKLLNVIVDKQLKAFCKSANGVSYVTERTIQKYYPCQAIVMNHESNKYFTSSYSSITIDTDYYLKPKTRNKSDFVVSISDAAMNTDRKGEKVVIDTVCQLRRKGYQVTGIIVGDGTMREKFDKYAHDIGVGQYIVFTGMITDKQKLREIISNSDLYMLPTKGEGLPRGVLEAMALGLPVLSTKVGGIAEVIPEDFLFDPGDVNGFSTKIESFINNESYRYQVALNNYNKALVFCNSNLQKRRNEFYGKLAALCDN